MNRPSRLKLSDVNPHLICVLCGGYFIDATTIVECLHSFCKTCIVRYLETSKYCPICDVQVHKTKPLQNVRSDHTLQNIVYKLVPGLYQNEMRQRREFYSGHPEVAPMSESDAGVINEETSCIYCPDEAVALCLEYSGRPFFKSDVDATKLEQQYSSTNKEKECLQHRRYLRCPAAVTVAHLKKLLRSKYGLSAEHRVDLMYNDELLKEDFSLMDVAYVYLWKRKGPMHLTYRIFERPHKRRKLDLERDKLSPPNLVADSVKNNVVANLGEIKAVLGSKPDKERIVDNQIPVLPELELKDKSLETSKEKCDMASGGAVDSGLSEEWKEVQLQISESGIMSVRNMEDLVSAVEGGIISGAFNETIISSGKAEETTEDVRKSELDNAVLEEKDISELPGKVKETTENSKEMLGDNQSTKSKNALSESVESKRADSKLPVDNKDVNGPITLATPSKVNVMDKMSGPRVCDVKCSFPKKEVSSKPKDEKNKEITCEIGTSVPSSECLPLNNTPQTGATVSVSTVSPSVTLTPVAPSALPSSLPSVTPIPKRSNSNPVGYKTLKTPPKTWNPSIPRASFLANHGTFGKSVMGGSGNMNGNASLPGQSVSTSKAEVRADAKMNSSGLEGGSNNGVRLPPTSPPKPLRFFKMRNNMPRYLGNPSSGVKPMYQVQAGVGGNLTAPSAPKSSLPSTKIDPKVSSATQLPTLSTVTECKVDKSGSVTAKVAFLVTPTSKSSQKAQCGTILSTSTSAGQSAPSTFLQTSVSPVMTSHPHTQLPAARPTQSLSPFVASTTLTSSGYHPSLPPSISMIFGQSRPAPAERPTSQTPPPAVQRVPASVHHSHHFNHPHPVTPIHILQHRQAAKTPGKLNGELGNSDAKSFSKIGPLDSPGVAPMNSEAQKEKEGPSGEVLKEPVNGKIEGSSIAAKTPLVDGKSMAPSKC